MSNTSIAVPEKGQQAPEFELPSNLGGRVKLADFKGKYLVLYFYPRDNTPGCTTEAQQFRQDKGAFERLGAHIVGVSPDTVESHCKFADKYGLNFALLADTEHEVATKYGVWAEKNMYGRKTWGVQRSTFLIGPGGTIVRAWPKVKADGHAKQVLAELEKAVKG